MKHRLPCYCILLLLILAPYAAALASDHIDGPVTVDHPVADITDLFAFPSPERRGWLTLILTVYAAVPSDGHFADQVTYSFLVRSARVSGAGLEAGFETSGDYRLSCTFETPHWPFSPHWVTCTSSSGASAHVRVDDTSGDGSTDSLRLFAGRRSDPFFFNARWATEASAEGRLLPENDSNTNTMTYLNVLSVVVEIDVEKELGQTDGSLFAIAGETTTDDENGGGVRRIDRIGRPEITNVTMVAHDAKNLKDLYNATAPFDLEGTNIDLYRKRLRNNVAWYDRLDPKESLEWTPETGGHLAEVLLNDFLVVDVSKPYAVDTYFEIEYSVLRGESNSTCGGRAPNADVMDVIYSMLIRGGQSPQSDGVDRPARPAADEFPYLAAPNNGPVPAVKSFLGRAGAKVTIPGRTRYLGISQLVSGAAALTGTVMLIVYGARLLIVRIRRRKISALKRARILGIIAVIFGIASVCGLITEAFSLPYDVVLVCICVIGLIRRHQWTTRASGQTSGSESSAESAANGGLA